MTDYLRSCKTLWSHSSIISNLSYKADYYTSIEPNSSDASSCSLGDRHANHSKKSMADKGLVTGYYRLSI